VAHEFYDIGANASALADSVHNSSKIVIGQNQISGLLGHVTAILPHRNAHVRGLQGGSIVDTIAWKGRRAGGRERERERER